MDQVHVVRHKVLVEGRTQRAVARELGISRVTVQKYLTRATPARYDTSARGRPVWDAVGPRIERLLAESTQWTGGKQRLTATRLHQLLRAEGQAVGVTLVKQAVAEWRRQRREVMIPLTYRAGDLAEVDFFEVLIDVAGVRRKAWLFLLRLMYSGRDFGWIYERQDQISFLDGHVRAFAHLGVPARVAYDNLRLAVRRILVGGERLLTARFTALASHYDRRDQLAGRPGSYGSEIVQRRVVDGELLESALLFFCGSCGNVVKLAGRPTPTSPPVVKGKNVPRSVIEKRARDR